MEVRIEKELEASTESYITDEEPKPAETVGVGWVANVKGILKPSPRARRPALHKVRPLLQFLSLRLKDVKLRVFC